MLTVISNSNKIEKADITLHFSTIGITQNFEKTSVYFHWNYQGSNT